MTPQAVRDTPLLFDVHFDGAGDVVGHLCAEHRAIGQLLQCPEAWPNGDCPHVQTRPCDCSWAPACAACEAASSRAN